MNCSDQKSVLINNYPDRNVPSRSLNDWAGRQAHTFAVLDSRSQTRNEIVGISLGRVWTFPIPPFCFVFSCYLFFQHVVLIDLHYLVLPVHWFTFYLIRVL
jgi:hypothetical protein